MASHVQPGCRFWLQATAAQLHKVRLDSCRHLFQLQRRSLRQETAIPRFCASPAEDEPLSSCAAFLIHRHFARAAMSFQRFASDHFRSC